MTRLKMQRIGRLQRVCVSHWVGEHPFAYQFTLDQTDEFLRQIGRDAANPELPIDWVTADRLCTRIRQMRIAIQGKAA